MAFLVCMTRLRLKIIFSSRFDENPYSTKVATCCTNYTSFLLRALLYFVYMSTLSTVLHQVTLRTYQVRTYTVLYNCCKDGRFVVALAGGSSMDRSPRPNHESTPEEVRYW